jgi:hypothetical protein
LDFERRFSEVSAAIVDSCSSRNISKK